MICVVLEDEEVVLARESEDLKLALDGRGAAGGVGSSRADQVEK